MSEIYVTKSWAMAKRAKNSKFNFEFDAKRKTLSQPYIFIRGDVPLLSDSDYSHFPNTDHKAKKMKLNSKGARNAAKRSILA